MTDKAPLKIDFVSDVMCPWCVIGLGGLNQALDKLKAEGISADITCQPFELNPQIAIEGENLGEHIQRKYGSTPEQSAANRAMIRERAAEVGFDMQMSEHSRMWNTFDAHRLLHWAHETAPERQLALKMALFTAHFTLGRNISDAGILTEVAQSVGFDRAEAAEVLASSRYVTEVRASEQLWQSRGITSVPAVVINDQYLISGGQPASVFENALRQISGETAQV
ncbi:DsbA family oxidoreductase [Brevundimonas terrae]|uniref:DsbA family oxidoreductase n=1 Tax=Brevundimonas terrae TaxID=363631 RepID=A0ABN0Y924_9CAUL|nr:DsbA family oxidoreductase [Brevundimonas terrae]NIJ27723.1 putative DsbA family dithiol-disulfide isomerase [Brevundimonas terrae]